MTKWIELPDETKQQVALTAKHHNLSTKEDPNGTPEEFSLVWLALKCFEAGKATQHELNQS